MGLGFAGNAYILDAQVKAGRSGFLWPTQGLEEQCQGVKRLDQRSPDRIGAAAGI